MATTNDFLKDFEENNANSPFKDEFGVWNVDAILDAMSGPGDLGKVVGGVLDIVKKQSEEE